MYSEEYTENKTNNIDYNNRNSYDSKQIEQKDNGFWSENKNLIIKIVIIVLCVFILFWLVFKIIANNKKNEGNNSYEENIVAYSNNLDSLRLAAEKYFFIDGNLPKSNESLVMTLNDLNTKGYVGSIVDANSRACDMNSSNATLMKLGNNYFLNVNLICDSSYSPKVYRYNLDTMSCLNCSGFTHMSGIDDEDSNKVLDDEKNQFSCNSWSEWMDSTLNDSSLEVRTRVLIRGAKVVKISSGKSYKYCPSGYEEDNGKCVKFSSEVKVGDLTLDQYTTYNVLNKPCDGPYVVNGDTIIKNCQYQFKEYVDMKTRYTGDTVYGDTIITDYIEEKDLPEGYVRVDGSEKTQYSYRIKECEK